jgi:hypothetical protein
MRARGAELWGVGVSHFGANGRVWKKEAQDMPANRLPLVSPLDRPFDTTFGLLRVRPAANAMPLFHTPTMRLQGLNDTFIIR